MKQKIYILIHIRFMRPVGDKTIFARPTSGNKTFFSALLSSFLFIIRVFYLTQIWMGFLGVRFEVVVEEGIKLARIMLDTSNLTSKYTHI